MVTSHSPDRLNEAERFDEYFRACSEFDAKRAAFKLLSPAEMRRLTAGGYQVFDATSFPPVALDGSIAEKKLKDLDWTEANFHNKSVLEIGSQLGFFGFIATHLGASRVVGVDVNPTFVYEANKFSAYFKNLCKWSDDRIKFQTQPISVNNQLPEIADIIVVNSIIHWLIIQNENSTIEEILLWLHTHCNNAVLFEGCVTAEEKIMQDHGVSIDRYNEDRFLVACEKIFNTVKIIGRCSYNDLRLVVRLYK